MLDWSYNLLSASERAILGSLSVFVGHFTLEGALAVASDDETGASAVADAVTSFVDKSLVWIADTGESTFYRLPDTTRSYAAAKLAESGGEGAVARRHALYYVGLFSTKVPDVTTFGQGDMSVYAPHLGNIRAALDWSFSPVGEPPIGVALAANFAPLFLGLSLLDECERWCERALQVLGEADRGSEQELALQVPLAIASMFTRGNTEEVRTAIETALALAETLEAHRHQLHLLAGLSVYLARTGDARTALAAAKRSAELAEKVGDPAGIVMAEWMLGSAYHVAGDQAAAQHHCELGFSLAEAWNCTHADFFGYDHRVRTLVSLARALWLRGFSERAMETARQAVSEAMARGRPVDIIIALTFTTQVFLWAGERHEAADRVEAIIAHAIKYSFRPYHAVGLAMKGELMVEEGNATMGIRLLRGALATLEAERHSVLVTVFYRALAAGLARTGQFSEAILEIEKGLELAQQRGGTFDLPDLLRARGEILLMAPDPDIAAAERSFLDAIELAREQFALGWELKAAIALARLWARDGRIGHARDLLGEVLSRFTEGFDTEDLLVASQLIEQLKPVSQGRKPGYPGGRRGD